ncbi:hypothetical protein IV203_016287 [Nitzschia inconspicua]|uniref:PPIase cyclophilin-type domain-containing protein n=1 Tax=Nitzschia inconspicua TaxID=303405 RepID=A0A9K3KPQ6_9STRA|nr:hypothetical protein IV203_016287 [Nitzschia inconspicua]
MHHQRSRITVGKTRNGPWLAFWLFMILLVETLVVEGFVFGSLPHSTCTYQIKDLYASASRTEEPAKTDTVPGKISASSIYMDIEVANQPIGRLVFHLTNPSPLPIHAENFVQLIKGSRRGIDPKAHYVGCEFDYSPASVEDGMGRYRWGHQLRGRGRNALGRADQPISDPRNQLQCTHSCFGGQYYGNLYTEIEGDPGVFLTVPVVGPGFGSSKFSIVRVGESPKEWKERLLINSGIIGRMDPSSLETLHAMARQRIGPPKLVACGVLEID